MLESIASYLPKPLKILAIRFSQSPLDSFPALGDFVRTRASYVAQTAMFGYLKARMGTQFPRFFQDEVFSRSIRIASANLFVSCLGDLTVFAIARVQADSDLADDEAAELALAMFTESFEGVFSSEDDTAIVPKDAIEAFSARCAHTDWASAANATQSFAGSERDIIRFAPVIDAFKDADREIVGNSIRFRWKDVRDQLRRRLDARGVTDDWRRRRADAADDP